MRIKYIKKLASSRPQIMAEINNAFDIVKYFAGRDDYKKYYRPEAQKGLVNEFLRELLSQKSSFQAYLRSLSKAAKAKAEAKAAEAEAIAEVKAAEAEAIAEVKAAEAAYKAKAEAEAVNKIVTEEEVILVEGDKPAATPTVTDADVQVSFSGFSEFVPVPEKGDSDSFADCIKFIMSIKAGANLDSVSSDSIIGICNDFDNNQVVISKLIEAGANFDNYLNETGVCLDNNCDA